MADREYKFIEEQIRSQGNKRIIKYLKKAAIAAVFGVIFGIVAAVSMYITTGIIGETPKEPEKEVSLIFATASPIPDENADQNNSVNDDNNKPDEDKKELVMTEPVITVDDYKKMNNAFIKYCKSYESTIVTIAGISHGVDYFDNEVENKVSFYGLIIQKDNNKLYVLTEYDDIDENEKYHIDIKEGINIEAFPVGFDKLTGLVVMTADLSGLDKDIIDELNIAQFGNSNMIDVGDIVAAIGKPMGKMNSIGYGIVSNEPENLYITDRKIRIYNTDIRNVEDGQGIIMNINGEVVGIITHKFNNTTSLSCFIGISELNKLIEQMMNSENRGGMGLVPKDIDSNYFPGREIENGIYVSDVYADSAAIGAGIVIGDIITSIEGVPVKNVIDYMDILSRYHADDEIEVDLFRDYASKNRIRTVKVKLSTVN